MRKLDPEEGSGFLKRILEDAISYYLPKTVNTETLLSRVRQVVASHRVEMFIQNKIEEDRKSLELAAHIQRSLLPVRSIITPRGFYASYRRPVDIVSGDLFVAVPYGTAGYLYVLGDIQICLMFLFALLSYLNKCWRKPAAKPAVRAP